MTVTDKDFSLDLECYTVELGMCLLHVSRIKLLRNMRNISEENEAWTVCIIPKRAICSFVIIIFLYDLPRKDICLYMFFNYCFSRTFFFSCSWIRPYQLVWLGLGYIFLVKSVSKLSPTEIGVGTYLMSVACFPLRVCQKRFYL